MTAHDNLGRAARPKAGILQPPRRDASLLPYVAVAGILLWLFWPLMARGQWHTCDQAYAFCKGALYNRDCVSWTVHGKPLGIATYKYVRGNATTEPACKAEPWNMACTNDFVIVGRQECPMPKEAP